MQARSPRGICGLHRTVTLFPNTICKVQRPWPESRECLLYVRTQELKFRGSVEQRTGTPSSVNKRLVAEVA